MVEDEKVGKTGKIRKVEIDDVEEHSSTHTRPITFHLQRNDHTVTRPCGVSYSL